MYSLKRLNKYFITIASLICLLVLGVSCFFLNANKVFAETVAPSYFVAQNGETTYASGSTVFLNAGETLDITFGKPNTVNEDLIREGYIDKTLIGDYAVAMVQSSFNIQINGTSIDNLEGYYNSVNYDFIKNPTTNPTRSTFQYLEMSINLADAKFPTGKYVLTFTDYTEFTGTDFRESDNTKSFSVVFYVFNTTDYFESDLAQSQKTNFENVYSQSPANASYKNYYYFNYSNYTTYSNTANYLPVLTFDASKFSVSITKVISGVNKSCTINKFLPNYINLLNTQNNFIDFTYNAETDRFSITFFDIGDYKISYDFIYQSSATEYVNLQSAEISKLKAKSDILYLYGYQMFYSGSNETRNNEFKLITNGQTADSNSADVSYLLSYDNLKQVSTAGETLETDLLTTLLAKTPASTNQPAITTLTNATLIENYSYYYQIDQTTNDWAVDGTGLVKIPFKNDPFTTAGTYLLKLVYTYNNFYDADYGFSNNNIYFTQFFYFSINTTIPTFSVEEIFSDNTTAPLSSESFTNNSVKITLSTQSIFNAPVKLKIYSRDFNANMSPTDSRTFPSYEKRELTPTDNVYTINVDKNLANRTYNQNYMIKLLYGNDSKKTQTSYFTIDDTDFQNVEVLPVSQSQTTTLSYIKNFSNPVEFFTSDNVSAQWDEKASGAKSYAHYKYIPFKKVSNVSPNAQDFLNNRGIATNYALDIDKTATYIQSAYNNTKNYSLLTSDMIFSNQGMYVLYIIDDAGNSMFKSFCIDRTDIIIWQMVGGQYSENINYNNNIINFDNVVSSNNVTLQWGQYKFIKLNNLIFKDVNENKLADKWFQTVLYEKLITNADEDIQSNNNQLYFSVEISDKMVVQTGNSYNYQSNTNYMSYFELLETVENYTFVKELTYVYYLIDESNKYFDFIQEPSNNNDALSQEFIQNSSLSYRLTTSSDASNANLLINNTTSGLYDVSLISNNSVALSQAGFTDSRTYDLVNEMYNQKNDLRTKYYVSTGSTNKGDVPLLSYIYKSTSSIEVASVKVYYYPFVIENGVYKLSDTANELTYTLKSLTGVYAGYSAFNINPEYDLETNTYKTLDGKYVIVRTYAENTVVNDYDFPIRESVIIVDREDIVSLPDATTNKSYIGENIFINVANNDSENSVKFTNIYASKNNDTYILKTNKLPVVVYVPITKFGTGTSENNNYFSFVPNNILRYYYEAIQLTQTNDYLLKRAETNSLLNFSYFGTNASLSSNFNDTNLQKTYLNSSFDLTMKITDNNGNNYDKAIILNGNNADGYYLTADLTSAGIYTVEIIQNATNGTVYPNLYNTYKFVFQIIQSPPSFDFQSEETNSVFNQDMNGIYYTNENTVKVVWTDPSNDYLAKIDQKGIYYYSNINGKQSIKTSIANIKKDLTKENTYYFTIDISSLPSGTTLTVHMQYIGTIQNNYTQIDKNLYIDREAPETVLNGFIANSTIDNISIASLSRVYVDKDSQTTISSKMYNRTTTEGSVAYYTFAVKYDASYLSSLFSAKNAQNNYYSNGYYYYVKKIDINNYSMTNISSAKNAIASHKDTISNMSPNNYYEIVEIDLAGNISIYTIYLVNPALNNLVLTYEKEATAQNTSTYTTYKEIQTTTEIFAKSYFNINYLNLYNYNWLLFQVDNTTYFKSPLLNNDEFYNFTTWNDLSQTPSIVNIENILHFDKAGIHSLKLNDSASPKENLATNYSLDIFIVNKTLTFKLLTTENTNDEGIIITGNLKPNEVIQYPVSMKIYSYENNKFTSIYDFKTFVSTNEITFTQTNNVYEFVINSPKTAYKYEFYDNYGISYVEYHSVGNIKLTDEQKVVNYNKQTNITDLDNTTNSWYVGYDDIIYNYSDMEYTAFIKIYYLEYDTVLNDFLWKEYVYSSGKITDYGCELVKGITTPYFKVSNSIYDDNSISQITIFAQKSINNLTTFTGNSIKAIITLENKRENIANNIKIDRILINNITPIITLQDKNSQDKTYLLDSEYFYSGLITIKYSKITLNNNYIFPIFVKMQYNNGNETNFASGTTISTAGYYVFKTYIQIDEKLYHLDTKTLSISQASNDYFRVVKQIDDSIIQPTGEIFEKDGYQCYWYYIVNADYIIRNNENQGVKVPQLIKSYTDEKYTTNIYYITNEGEANVDNYSTMIAITYIKPETSLLAKSFGYDIKGDEQYTKFTDTSSKIVITENNQNFTELTISFNSYYAVEQNKIIPTIYYGENEKTLFVPTLIENTINKTYSFTISNSGYYTIYFSDTAGNRHLFNNSLNAYTLTFVKGVAYEINGASPINNGIYDDKVIITLPSIMSSIYNFNVGGKPLIHVEKNSEVIEVSPNENGEYIISGAGYYKVYFDAKIGNESLRQEAFEFTINSSKEYKSSFNFANYSNYEIIEVLKNGVKIDYSNYFEHNSTTLNLKNITVSLYDEITGAGEYQITVATNSNIANETFTFKINIKNIGIVPIKIGLAEGGSTTDNIKVSFNAYNIYKDIGECVIKFGNETFYINKEYISSLEETNSYYNESYITETGTHFVQVYSSSDKLLFSYKVIKTEPLNAISIILIVVGVIGVAGLVITISLLRRKMKIK